MTIFWPTIVCQRTIRRLVTTLLRVVPTWRRPTALRCAAFCTNDFFRCFQCSWNESYA